MDVDESVAPGERPRITSKDSRRRRPGGCRRAPVRLVLGADTTVVVEGEILGKPADEEDARRMLRRLSGRRHEVLTGVALVRAETGRSTSGVARTRVRFAELSGEEVERYVETGEPLDKAGAYAVQGRAAPFIESIEGEYWNVVGLPVRLVYDREQSD